MGLSLFKSCGSGYTRYVLAPNPDPKRWTLLKYYEHPNAYVLVVKYHDATNFEGTKIMVYRGKFPGAHNLTSLDPHFTPDDPSPIARFRPDTDGIAMANELAERQ
jgi:hypothetical protein